MEGIKARAIAGGRGLGSLSLVAAFPEAAVSFNALAAFILLGSSYPQHG